MGRRWVDDSPRGILWHGPSAIDGSPIVAYVTGSENRKLGNAPDISQVWILRSDVDPVEAIRAQLDRAVCGACPLTGGAEGFARRSCYVDARTLSTVWRGLTAADVAHVAAGELAGRWIRWGAYGDPAALPPWLFHDVTTGARAHVAYTRAWNTRHGRHLRGLAMASVHSPAEERRALAAGWATFRIGARDGSDATDAAAACPNETRGTQCRACGLCDGAKGRAIVHRAHGIGAHHTPAERKRRRLPVAS